ncbi:response regulator transcription factor [Sagittula sp. NFXS13]|uniref:hypothetical protein n=1 Tax=Sagittula sp. NFXS13 TaxID=2819095 RepID=UPI0032DEE0E1
MMRTPAFIDRRKHGLAHAGEADTTMKDNVCEAVAALRAVRVEGQIMVDPGVHRFQARASATRDGLTDSEQNVLIDLAISMTDKGIAQRRAMSVRSVQNRLLSIYQKLEVEEDDQDLVNKRACAVYRALVTRTINVETMIAAARALELWLEQRDQ